MTAPIHFDESLTGPIPWQEVALHLHPDDNVLIARVKLSQGVTLTGFADSIPIQGFIPAGHKIACEALPTGAVVRRYGQVIGFATADIQPGDHVHVHNVGMGAVTHDYAFGADVQPVDFVPVAERLTFQGFRRADGRVGTRNLIAVIATVNCSAHVCHRIAEHFTPDVLADYPHVDGVVALAHTTGCASSTAGLDNQLLQRTLAGFIRHPNIAASLLVGLGCEVNQAQEMLAAEGLTVEEVPILTIQGEGGTQKTINAGIAQVKEMLPGVNAQQRVAVPASELTVALQCGGSDSWSGLTANPVVGQVADLIVAQGGTVVLSETPEIYGAEPILTRRAATPDVGEKLLGLVHWWEEYAAARGLVINNNPSAGNKVGGLTTIYEKSLGAVAKGGTTPLNAVYDYAERVTARGLTFMDGPGYDPVAITGQIAGGCTLVLFTTGRGSVFGSQVAPTLKIATNQALYAHMTDDMDFDAGQVLAGQTITAAGAALFEQLLAVAGGQPSKSEAQGIGAAEFVPWTPVGIL